MTWMHRLRLRVFAVLVAVAIGVIGLVSIASIPVWPAVGMAVAAIALVVNGMTSKLSHSICLGCGASLAGQARGEHGVACPECGLIDCTLASEDDTPGRA